VTRHEVDVSAVPLILVNGIESQSVPATDRGLAYGDGVFRTLLLRDGAPQQWERQYRKLAHDCAVLNLDVPGEALLATELQRLGERAPRLVAKIIVTRGASPRGYRYDPGRPPNRILLASPVPERETHAVGGVRTRRCKLHLSHQPAFAGIKHLNRLENVLARSEWEDEQISEGILCDVAGWVIGGTMTNLFAVREGELVTPDLGKCGVAGVTRERVLEAARQHGVRCHVVRLAWSELMAADELFLVNSVAGAWPVRQVDERTWPVGPVTRTAQAWLET
jgi:4-amino-4-deoxychorismate lyase